MNIKWQILSNQVERRLEKMKSEGADQTTALAALGRAIETRINTGFRAGVDPWGRPWKPLNPKYRTGQPLRNTRRLQLSISSRVVGDAAEVGTNVRYARVHQYGATIVPKTSSYLAFPVTGGGFAFLKEARIPARPFMPMQRGRVDLPPAWAKSALSAMAKAMGL